MDSDPKTAADPSIRMTDKTGRPFTVREYRSDDRPALEAMYEDFRPKRTAQGLPPEGELQLRRWLSHVLERGIHLIVEMEGDLIGHAMLIPMNHSADETDSVELANFLHQSVRNRGIGTGLNRIALDAAREAGYDRVWLTVEPSNRAAIRSYRHAGFRARQASPWAREIEMEAEI